MSFSGIFYESVSYDLGYDGILDYDAIESSSIKRKTRFNNLWLFSILTYYRFSRFKQIADKVGAKLMGDIAHIAGLIAAKVHPSPVGYRWHYHFYYS
ncbi:hypothetical protein [Mycoplasmopsis cynos]|uniref:hypothetical protein n=1 Tax=Mycoplasmopsis cynos TaxID=171284 RepID=UPI003A5C7934